MAKKKKLNEREREEKFEENAPALKKYLAKKDSIIGLDLSTSCTGFYQLHKKEDSSISMAIKGGKKHINLRILDIVESIDNMIYRKESHTAIIEDYSFGLQGSTVAQLAELGGTVKTLLLRAGIGFFKIAPSTLKKFVLGPTRGKATGKEFMMMETLDRWGMKFTSSDVCDAYCLAQFLRHVKLYLEDPDAMKKWEQEMFYAFVVNRGVPITTGM